MKIKKVGDRIFMQNENEELWEKSMREVEELEKLDEEKMRKKEKKKKKKLKNRYKNDNKNDDYYDYYFEDEEEYNVDNYCVIEEKRTLEKKEVKDLKCFRYYDKEFIYPVFSYCLLSNLVSLLNIYLKPNVILHITTKEADTLQYYKNLLNDILFLWGDSVESYSVENIRDIENIFVRLNASEDKIIIWNIQDSSHIQPIKTEIKRIHDSLKNNLYQYCDYPFTALPLIYSKYNYTSDEIYTIILKESTENKTKNRNVKITTELGNYVYNFLSELDFRFDDNSDKSTAINQELSKKYDEYTNKFSECVGEKPLTWLRFECLLVSVFSYFIDVTLYDEISEEKEQLLKEAESAITGIKFQDDKQVLFDKILGDISSLKGDKEKILPDRPQNDLIDKFLNHTEQIGFLTSIDSKKVLCFKTKFLEEFLYHYKVDKTEFLTYAYTENKIHYNKDKNGVRFDVNIPLKKESKPINKKFYAFYI